MFPKWLALRLRKYLFRPYRLWARYQFARFEQATRNLCEQQRELLLRRITLNRDTSFGRDHNFAGIANVADFRSRVPVAPYEYYEPYIERLRAGEIGALLGGRQKLVMFALTSGSQAARKFIPITEEFVREFRRGWVMWGLKAARSHPGIFLGSILQLAGDWEEFRTAGGTPCGNVSGLVARMQRRLVQSAYCTPPDIARIKDVVARHYTVLRLAIPRDVSYLTSANPSTLVNLARLGDAERESLIRDIADGTLSSRFELAPELRERLGPRLAADPQRARELQQIVARTGRLIPKDYWPGLKLIGCWTGGAVGAYLRHFPALFGVTPVRDVGLIASEGRMTIPIESRVPFGVLDVSINYYEFIPEEEIDSAKPTVLEAHELVEGRNYFILLTTPSGFYRYNISDLVRVVGKFHQAPVLEFLNKGAHFSSITGEKLSESQVTRAVDLALGDVALTLTAFTLAPCWSDLQPHYTILVERSDIPTREQACRFLARFEAALCRLNSEYHSKRESRRLGPPRLSWLPPGAWSEFCRKRLERTGGALEQYKHPCLVNDWGFITQMPVEQEVQLENANGACGAASAV
jgi:hypothetical protein